MKKIRVWLIKFIIPWIWKHTWRCPKNVFMLQGFHKFLIGHWFFDVSRVQINIVEWTQCNWIFIQQSLQSQFFTKIRDVYRMHSFLSNQGISLASIVKVTQLCVISAKLGFTEPTLSLQYHLGWDRWWIRMRYDVLIKEWRVMRFCSNSIRIRSAQVQNLHKLLMRA